MQENIFISWILNRQELFVNTARKHLHGYLKSMAEDVAQDAILTMLRKANSFNGCERQFDAYANRTVINKCIDLSRRKSTKCTPHDDMSLFCFDNSENAISVLEEIIRLERHTSVRHAILELNERDKKLVLLKNKFELSHRQISEHMNIPEGHIGTYYKRALDKLKEILKKYNVS